MDYSLPEKRFRTTDGFIPLSLRPDKPSRWNTKTGKPGSSAYRVQASICVGLHVLLILAHVGLLFICFGHYERSVTFAITNVTLEWYPLITTTFMQVLGTLFLAVLVAYTQALAFRSDLYVRQTLTALHDKSNAWLGLGAACTSLWDQVKLRAAPVSVTYITAYLFGVWVLHITIPTALNVVPYNATLPTVHPTNLANITTNADYASAYDILLVYDQIHTLGLQDNMVYDVIPQVQFASGTATVNASVYSVDCAALPNADPTLHHFEGDTQLGQPNMTWLYFNIDNAAGQGAIFSASVPYNASSIYTGEVTNVKTNCNVPPADFAPGSCWTPIVLLSTVSVLDSSGNEALVPGGPWRPIDPQVIVPPSGAYPAAMITAVQLLACNVQIQNIKIEVAADTRVPVLTLAKPQLSTSWKNWTWPEDSPLTDQLRAAQNAPFFSPPSSHSSSSTIIAGSVNITEGSPPMALPGFLKEAFEVLPIPENTVPNALLKSSSPVTVVPTAFDVFLTEDLRIALDNRTNITLGEINHSLEKALAATFWYGNNVNYSSSHAINGLIKPENAYTYMNIPILNMTVNNTNEIPQHGEATILVLVQRLRLNLSIAPIVVGLVASLGLLVLCVLVIRIPASARAAFDPNIVVDSGGLLQFTWLLGSEPHLAQVEDPQLENLRTAGMFNVQIGDRVRKRLSSRQSTLLDKGDFEDYSDDDLVKEPLVRHD